MIGTITLNPSVDKRYLVKNMEKGTVMRAEQVENSAGGKGLNVGRVIRLLGEEVIATGFLGGSGGAFISKQLAQSEMGQRFVSIRGETRSCLAIISRDRVHTEILEPGPEIQVPEWQEWLTVYEELLTVCDYVCASGSLPGNLPVSVYGNLAERAGERQVKFLLDTSGEALLEGIKGKPFFLKPNLDELAILAGKKITGKREVLEQIERLQGAGIECIVVSLGAEGAIAGIGKKKYAAIVPSVDAVNVVGSGDALVAGFAVALRRGYSERQLLSYACACGSANAMEAKTGFVSPSLVDELLQSIKVIDL
jgi:tagatose 6-phosphate kinase